MSVRHQHPRPCVAVDCVVFGIDLERQDLEVLLVQHDLAPQAGGWALPGGHVSFDESVEAAAVRELGEATGLERVFLEQLYTFGAVARDPRTRVVSVAYYALVNLADQRVRAATGARDAAWFGVHGVPALVLDHEEILAKGRERLRGKVRYQPIAFELLPPKFTLTQLQQLYEIILERALDKRNFRKKITKMDLLVELDEVQADVAHRAARLYRFDERRYEKLVKQGLMFEL